MPFPSRNYIKQNFPSIQDIKRCLNESSDITNHKERFQAKTQYLLNILDVSQDETVNTDINYKKLAKALHPDKNNTSSNPKEDFQALSAANVELLVRQVRVRPEEQRQMSQRQRQMQVEELFQELRRRREDNPYANIDLEEAERVANQRAAARVREEARQQEAQGAAARSREEAQRQSRRQREEAREEAQRQSRRQREEAREQARQQEIKQNAAFSEEVRMPYIHYEEAAKANDARLNNVLEEAQQKKLSREELLKKRKLPGKEGETAVENFSELLKKVREGKDTGKSFGK